MNDFPEGWRLETDQQPLTLLPLKSPEYIKLNKLVSVYDNIITLNCKGYGKKEIPEKKLRSIKRTAMRTILKYSRLPEDQWELANRKWYVEYVN